MRRKTPLMSRSLVKIAAKRSRIILVFAVATVVLVAGVGTAVMVVMRRSRGVCSVHGVVLRKGEVPVAYGLFLPENAKNQQARQRLFPNANTVSLGGCCVDADKLTDRVLYCPLCRVAQEEWLAKWWEDAENEFLQRMDAAISETESLAAEGYNLLDEASTMGYVDAVKRLLELGVDVNGGNAGQSTPLHGAAHRDNVEVTRILLAAGAEVDAKDATGKTSLQLAAMFSSREIVAVLVEHGADVRVGQEQGNYPHVLAADWNLHNPDVETYLRAALGQSRSKRNEKASECE